MTINRKVACRSRISGIKLVERLKVTLMKLEAMRQGIDLIRKKENRGETITVMFHGTVRCLGSSFSPLPGRHCSLRDHAREACSHVLLGDVVASASHPLLDAEWLHTFVVGRAEQPKIFPRETDPRLDALHVEGIANSGCSIAACTLTTQKSEQRCCAAA